MNVTQLHTFVNAATEQILGETGLVSEDLSNIVDVGKAIEDAGQLDSYVKKLVNHIGRVQFVNRQYQGGVPSVLMDSWEFGSILQKISPDLPDAQENSTWALNHNQDYSPNVFYKPSVSVKFFNSKTTFEIAVSFTELQVKESFSNAEQLNAFISMLVTAVNSSMTAKLDGLIMRTITNFIYEVGIGAFYDAATDKWNYSTGNGQAINLLAGYKAVTGDTSLTTDKAFNKPEFIAYAVYTIGVIKERMKRISVLFNASGKERFTPESEQRLILLADFSKAADVFLYSNTFNADKVALPAHDAIPYWQGSGEAYALEDVSKVMAESTRNFEGEGEKTPKMEMTGIIGVLFDKEALGVTNLDNRVTTNYNPKAEFYTNFYKLDAGFFNDLDENFILFYMA